MSKSKLYNTAQDRIARLRDRGFDLACHFENEGIVIHPQADAYAANLVYGLSGREAEKWLDGYTAAVAQPSNLYQIKGGYTCRIIDQHGNEQATRIAFTAIVPAQTPTQAVATATRHLTRDRCTEIEIDPPLLYAGDLIMTDQHEIKGGD